jgi:23S rRNA pseudouridine2605 synthase
MRLNRYLAACGMGSRRAVEHLIIAGRVSVNGQICSELATQITSEDKVTVDGKSVALPEAKTCLVLNKPSGYLCSRTDPVDKPLVFELLPPEWQHLHYVGRLDFLSRGLLLFSDDGALTQALLHPSREVERTYHVQLNHPLEREALDALRNGLTLEDGLQTRPAQVRPLRDGFYELILREGKNREIRRMMTALGCRVVDLCRVQYGPIHLGNLKEGQWRRLSDDELQVLQHVCGLA